MSDIDGKSASHTSPDQGQMRVTDNVFTLFGSAVNKKPHRGKDCTLDELHNKVKTGEWWDKVDKVRELAPYKDEKDRTGKKKSPRASEYSKLKEDTLPYAVVSGTWDLAHRHADGSSHGKEPCETNGIKTPSGIRLLDLDGLSEKQQKAIKATLDAGIVPWAAACWKSTGGDGLHLFAALDPPPTCQSESHAAFAALIADLGRNMPSYARHSSDPSSKNLMRPSFVSADSDARIYPDACPLRWQDLGNSGADQDTQPTLDTFADQPNQQGNKTASRQGNKGQQNRKDAPPELVRKALDWLAAGRAGEIDNHMLAVLGNMKAYGRTFDEFDAWAADAGCTCDREPRWNAAPQANQSDQPGWAIVNLARKHYGMPKNERPSRHHDEHDDQDHNEHDNNDEQDDQDDHDDGNDNQGKPIFPSDANGLLQAAEYIGISFRFNLASNGMEVRPDNATMRRRLHSTGSTWPGDWRQMDDAIAAKIRAIIADECLNKKSNRQIVKWRSGNWKDSMLVVANDYRVDPWLEWITSNAPEWDGRDRFATMANECWGVDSRGEPAYSDAYKAQWARTMVCGAVARMSRPGCVADVVPIITGKQGIGKSAGYRELFPDEWQPKMFRDSLTWRDIADPKLVVERSGGAVIIEIPEMAKLNEVDLELVKSAITRRTDFARGAYDYYSVDTLRRFILVSTSNSDEPLPDDEENRRFMPLRADDANDWEYDVRAYMEVNRLQVWAQALAENAIKPMGHLMPRELKAEQAEINEWARIKDDQADAIVAHIIRSRVNHGTLIEMVTDSGYFVKTVGDEKVEFTESEVAEKLSNRSLATKVGKRLKNQGWTYQREQKDGVREKVYYRPERGSKN